MAKDIATRVVLRDRYDIFSDQPLPEFDSSPALAYAGRGRRDDRADYVALVCDPKMQPRFAMIGPLTRMSNPNLMVPVDWGVVDWPPEGRRCPVLLFEPPQATRLLPSLDSRIDPVHEETVVRRIVGPIYQILRDFREQGLVHRAIRPDNVYIDRRSGERFKLGQCLTAPPAALQPFAYEPIESCLASPYGRGEGTVADDLYALGVTVLSCLIGRSPMFGMPDADVVQLKLAKGSYVALTQDVRLSLSMMEMLRGLLNDDAAERWSIEELGQWINGRRGSSRQPSLSTRASRSFRFAGRDLYTTREVAHALWVNWDQAGALIASGTLDQWLRRALGDEKKIAGVNAAKELIGEGGVIDDPTIARVCIALDPTGPIRLRGFSSAVDGIASYLAAHGDDPATREQFRSVMGKNLIGFWLDCQVRPRTDLVHHLVELKAAREHVERTRLGEGFERAVYELNRNLPCLSPLVDLQYAMDVDQLLGAYAALAASGLEVKGLIDRHVAAYISTHAPAVPASALRDVENQADPYLPLVASVRILSSLQERNTPPRLYPGLTEMAAKLLDPALGRFHSKELRKRVAAELKGAAKSGRLVDVLNVVDNRQLLDEDERLFQYALSQYDDTVARLRQIGYERENRTALARVLGAQISSLISGGLALVGALVVVVMAVV